MSAYIVSDKHIDALLTWVIETAEYQLPRKVDGMTVYDQPDLIGQILIDANAKSVNTRYSENDAPAEYIYHAYPRVLSPVEVIKACDCLNYQSCEFSGWKQSKAYRIVQSIREGAIDQLPGMNTAAWSIDG